MKLYPFLIEINHHAPFIGHFFSEQNALAAYQSAALEEARTLGGFRLVITPAHAAPLDALEALPEEEALAEPLAPDSEEDAEGEVA